MAARVISITAQARQVRFGPWLANIVAALLIGAGLLTFRVIAGAWLATVWCFVAFREGLRQGATEAAARRAAAAQQARR